MENKKTKLTISGSPKKLFKNIDSSKTQGQKTVVIEKRSSKPVNKGNFNRSPSSNFNKNVTHKTNFTNLRKSKSNALIDKSTGKDITFYHTFDIELQLFINDIVKFYRTIR